MNIYESIAAIIGEKAAVKKDKRNEAQRYMFRGIDDVMNTFNPLLAKYKVFAVPTVMNMSREERTNNKGTALIYTVLTVQYTFYAEDGSSVTAVTIGEGMDTGDKSVNKAMSAAYKYALFQVFCIPTEEMVDSEVDSHEVLPKAPEKEPDPEEERLRKSIEAMDKVAKERAEMTATCEECGKEILPYAGNSGRTVTVAQHCDKSKKKFGAVLCLDCIQQALR